MLSCKAFGEQGVRDQGMFCVLIRTLKPSAAG